MTLKHNKGKGSAPGAEPAVTVLMPVYNAEAFLRQAMESVLSQSFSDFELLILDDASSDAGVAIVESYPDPRIRLVRNDRNRGVAGTLNRGILLARGRYLARMDADDVSLPDRLERQAAFLDLHPEVDLVGVKVGLIDEAGRDIGSWPEDLAATTADEIRALLPVANCLAHPGVMMRREMALDLGYREDLPCAQDYDLWLRSAAEGRRMEKLDSVLLKYRVHRCSVTSRSNRSGAALKDIRIKWGFIADRVARRLPVNRFVLQVMRALLHDLVRLAAARSRAWCLASARKTLVRSGMLLGALLPARNRSRLFFFFPFTHVGGAEKVHADILSTVAGRTPWIFITNRSVNDAFGGLFEGKGRLFRIWPWLSHIVLRHLSTGFIAALINRESEALVFGANSPFFYDLIPYLHDGVECVDLLHAFGGGLEFVSLPHAARLDRRIVINRKTVDDLRGQYLAEGVPQSLLDRVRVIENRVEVPAAAPVKGGVKELRAIHVGRNSEEKRVRIVGSIARQAGARRLPCSFTLVGELVAGVNEGDRSFCRFTGELADYDALCDVYRSADVILVTSSSEGFPMVVMEAMAHGVVPVCTDVGGISVHVRDGVNGFLVRGDLGEEEIAASFLEVLERLQADRALLRRISAAAYHYCRANFSGGAFEESYLSLFNLAKRSSRQ